MTDLSFQSSWQNEGLESETDTLYFRRMKGKRCSWHICICGPRLDLLDLRPGSKLTSVAGERECLDPSGQQQR